MILFDTNNFVLDSSTIRIIYLNLLQARLKSNPNLYNLKFIENIIKDSEIPNIKNLFNAIFVDSNGNLTFQGNSNYGRVLRYIEFGGESIKPTHILQDTARELAKIIY